MGCARGVAAPVTHAIPGTIVAQRGADVRLSLRDRSPDKRVHSMRSTVFARACVALLLASATLAPTYASAQVDLAPFLKRHEVDQVQLSPNGQYLAATVPLEDSTALVVMTV